MSTKTIFSQSRLQSDKKVENTKQDASSIRPVWFHSLINNEQRGFGATLLRSMLAAIEKPYSMVVRCRNYCFNTGLFPAHPIDVPVLSVGNLTLGGTGKTPMVAWLAGWLENHAVRTAIVSRGYGGNDGHWNDEALELHQRLPSIPHIQNRNRVLGAKQAIAQHQTEVIVLDDAFQHRRIARNLDIVLIDALAPFGYEREFPRGLLREPLQGLSRAHVVALSRADAVGTSERAEIQQRVQAIAPGAIWLETIHAPQHWQSTTGKTIDLSQLAGASVAMFCGIGNPEGFRHTLKMARVQVVGEQTFPDHHQFTDQNMHTLDRWVRQLGPLDAVVCTHKDLVKLSASHIAGCPLYALMIGLEITQGQKAFEQELEKIITLVSNNKPQSHTMV